MAESRRGGLAGDGELDGAAETASLVGVIHGLSLVRMRKLITRPEYCNFDRVGQVMIQLRELNL